jgi:hypothetical protein
VSPNSDCCRYIELNPVRARMVAHPRDYAWSSYRAHADGEKDPVVSDHPLYRRLGRSAAERQQEYRGLFRAKLADEFVEALRAPPTAAGPWATSASSARSPRWPDAAPPPCPKAAHPLSTTTSAS